MPGGSCKTGGYKVEKKFVFTELKIKIKNTNKDMQ